MTVMTRRRSAVSRADEITDNIASLRQKRAAAQEELRDLQRDADSAILGNRAADSVATKLAMHERKVSALSREIARLEKDELPEAREADAEAVREIKLAAARELHDARLEIARELEEYAAKTDEARRRLAAGEDRYRALCHDAGYDLRELNGAAVAGMISAVLPGIVAELANQHNFSPTSGLGPLALVKSRAVERLSRRNRQ